jgi:hypothetical protein
VELLVLELELLAPNPLEGMLSVAEVGDATQHALEVLEAVLCMEMVDVQTSPTIPAAPAPRPAAIESPTPAGSARPALSNSTVTPAHEEPKQVPPRLVRSLLRLKQQQFSSRDENGFLLMSRFTFYTSCFTTRISTLSFLSHHPTWYRFCSGRLM